LQKEMAVGDYLMAIVCGPYQAIILLGQVLAGLLWVFFWGSKFINDDPNW
jgi:hypothetical protein